MGMSLEGIHLLRSGDDCLRDKKVHEGLRVLFLALGKRATLGFLSFLGRRSGRRINLHRYVPLEFALFFFFF